MMGARCALLVLFAGCAPSPRPGSPPPVAPEPVAHEPVTPGSVAPEPAEHAPPATPDGTPAPPPSDEPPGEPPPTAAPEPVTPPSSSPGERTPSAAEVSQCRARGGTIQRVCMMGTLTCVVRYRDAGKRCTDGADCTGDCLYEGEDPPPENPVGSCQRTSDPCGCRAVIVGGRAQPALCVD
jgi:hypothetical protein